MDVPTQQTAQLSVTIVPQVIPTFDPIGSYCEGSAIPDLPTTSNNNITGTWSPDLDNTATTTYTFTPDATSVLLLLHLTIIVNPLPTLSATAPPISCNAGTTTITVTATGGTAPLQYSIDGTTFQDENTFDNIPAGDYTITVRDAILCTATTTLYYCSCS